MRYFQRNFCAVAPLPLSPLRLPSSMEAHLWYVVPDQVKCTTLLKQYKELLSPCEKEYVDGIRSHDLQKCALLARALVRTTIARYQINCDVDPKSLKFKRNQHGKPEVDWHDKEGWFPLPLHFNISHTSSLVACGVTVNSPIGIDVEEKQRRIKNNVLAFAHRYFSSHEVEYLSAISNSEFQRQEFIKLWTLKEAYVKALGVGFSAAPFNTFTISLKNSTKGSSHPSEDVSKAPEITVKTSAHPEGVSNWQFGLLELATSHYAAICTENDNSSNMGIRLPMRLTAWRTIPFVEDECVSGTDAVLPIGGFVKQV